MSPNGEQPFSDQDIQVRQVTNYQNTWTEGEPGADGTFTVQLILDNGAAEYVLRPTAADMEVLAGLFKKGESVYFDISRRVLMFGNKSLG